MSKPRARGLGLDLPGEPGLKNALTDVPGVLVGHTTIIDDSQQGYGVGPIRTGVTAILPRGRETRPRPVWAGLLGGPGIARSGHSRQLPQPSGTRWRKVVIAHDLHWRRLQGDRTCRR
jgi:hypothetical protein